MSEARLQNHSPVYTDKCGRALEMVTNGRSNAKKIVTMIEWAMWICHVFVSLFLEQTEMTLKLMKKPIKNASD